MFRCLSSLADIPHEGYSPAAERSLAGGNRKFPHRLTFKRTDVVEYRTGTAEHMSISGVQDKISLKLVRGTLKPTDRDGEYILKPIPSLDFLKFKDDVPANEHLTMQIASQVFKIQTAVNACIYLSDGELAYITRRFDRRGQAKIAQEDFCQLSGRTEHKDGKNYKYDASYEEVGRLLRFYCSAYPVEIEKLYKQIVFSYVFSNGDAHLKNFSLYESEFGDSILTPAYDLLCTSLHLPDERRTALALFATHETDSFRQNAFYRRPDFLKLAEFYGIQPNRAERFLDEFSTNRDAILNLIARSFLSDAAKSDYERRFIDRLHAIA
jgi:serine/threonine-protein kinase HipA